MQVTGQTHFVHPQPKDLGVLGFLETELRQVHLVAESSLGRHCFHERLNVFGDGFFTGDELRTQEGGAALLFAGQLLPVTGILRKIEVGWVPEFGVSLGEQSEWERIPVQPSRPKRTETFSPRRGDSHDIPSSRTEDRCPTSMPAELKRESVLTKFDLFLQGNTLGLHHCEELGVHLSCQIRPIRTDVERIGEIVQFQGVGL